MGEGVEAANGPEDAFTRVNTISRTDLVQWNEYFIGLNFVSDQRRKEILPCCIALFLVCVFFPRSLWASRPAGSLDRR